MKKYFLNKSGFKIYICLLIFSLLNSVYSIGQYDLHLTQDIDKNIAIVGDTINVQLLVVHEDGEEVNDVIVVDTIDKALNFIGLVNPNNGGFASYDGITHTINWQLPTLGGTIKQDSLTFQVVVTSGSLFQNKAEITNSLDDLDSYAGNNDYLEDDLTLQYISVPIPYCPTSGDTLIYTTPIEVSGINWFRIYDFGQDGMIGVGDTVLYSLGNIVQIYQGGSYYFTSNNNNGVCLNENCGQIVIVEACFDLALNKTLAADQSSNVVLGEDINYEICVRNEGNISAYNILVADHIPNGLALSANDTNNWMIINSNLVTKTIIEPIHPGEEICLQIILRLNSGNPRDNFTNIAEIAGQEDEQGNNIKDEDSIPDLITENETESEDDFGFVSVTLPPCPIPTIIPQEVNICQGESIQLNTTLNNNNGGTINYKWTPAYGLSNPFIANPVATPLASTYYIIEIDSDFGGCINYDTIRVNVFDVPNPVFQVTTVCQGVATTFTDNSITYTNLTGWFWDFGDGQGTSTLQNPNYTYVNAGHYQVKLITTSTNGCRDSSVQQVTINPSAQAFSTAKGDTICVGACVELKAQGGSTFKWSPSATLNHDACFNPIACPTQTTTYSVTVTNDFGCESTDEVTITVIPSPTIDIVMTNVTECGKFDGILTINVTGLANNYQYSIDGGLSFRSNNRFNSLPASSYLVVIKGGGCEVPYAGNPVIIGDGLAPMITSVPTVNPDCSTTNGSIIINAGGTDLQYSINGGISFSTNNEFTDLAGGNYYIAVSATGGNCIAYYPPVTLIEPLAPTITNVTFTHPTDCGQSDGTLNIIADGIEGVEYSLNDGLLTIWQSSSNFINVSAGIYSVYVRNAKNTCVTPYALNNIELVAPPTPIIAEVAVKQTTDCGRDNGQITITATGVNLAYSIDGGINWEDFAVFNDLKPGAYNVLVANQNGTCAVTYTNNPIEVAYPDAVQIIEIQHSNPSDCGINDGRIEITTGNGRNDLIYSVDGGANWQNNSIFNNLVGGIYNVRVANSDESCMAIYPTIELIAPSDGIINSVVVTEGCDPINRTIIIAATSTTPLEYSIDGGVTYQASNNFINLDYGTYPIFIRNANDNCEVEYASNPVEINPPSNNGSYIDHIQAADPTICGATDGFIEVNATGGSIVYSIDGGINYGTQQTFDDLKPGKYWVYVKDEDTGCEEDYLYNPVELVGIEQPTISDVAATNLSDCNANNGMITIVADGDGRLEYSLDNSTWSRGNTFINLLPGLYNVWVRYDDESCGVSYINNPVVITVPTRPIITNCFGVNPSECDTNDGQLIITATSGQSPLKYSIDGGVVWQNSNEFTNLSAGIYSVAVANADETCKTIHPICVLTAPSPPFISEVLGVSPSSCGEDNGSITILADGQGGLEYSINGGIDWSANSFFANLAAGNYFIKVRNAADNCEIDYGQVRLNAPTLPTTVVSMDNTSTCIGSYIPVSITLSEHIAKYTIVGSGGYLNASVFDTILTFDAYLNNSISSFTITLENAAGCTVVEEFSIFQAGNPEADFIVHNPTCVENEVIIEFTGEASPAAILTWKIDGATIISSSAAIATTPSAANLVVQWPTSGGKTISLDIDDGGCTDKKVQNINVNKLPFADAGADITIYEGKCIQLQGVGNGSQFQWSPAIGLSATDIPNPMACPPTTTTYQLLVMSAEGCMVMDEVTITVGNLSADADQAIRNDGPAQDTSNIVCEEDIIPFNRREIIIKNCNEAGQLCLPIPLQELFNYDILVNDINYTGGFNGCNLDTVYAYTYFTIPDRGRKGLYKLHSWTINGQEYTGEFNTLNDLLNLMNGWDKNGNWKLVNEILAIQGGLPQNAYGQMNIEQVHSGAFASMELNSNILPTGTMLSFFSGTNEVIITNNVTGCSDFFTIIGRCEEALKTNCKALFDKTNTTYFLTDCKENAAICLNISKEDLSYYAIDQNNELYTGEIGTCESEKGQVQLYAPTGYHTFTATNELNGCTDEITIKVTCSNNSKDPSPSHLNDDNGLRSVKQPMISHLALPIAVKDEVHTIRNQPIHIDAQANDQISELESIELVENPKYGALYLHIDNTFTYQPNKNFCAAEQIDFFRYSICNNAGCDTTSVEIVVDCPPIKVFTAFSPNRDGINDYFKIEGLASYPNNELSIFDRAGKQLIKVINYKNNWRGEVNGALLHNGVYFYVLKLGGGKHQSGFFQIRR